MDSHPITAQSLERYYHIDGSQLERHYKEHLSDYRVWDQPDHADKWLLLPQNMGTHLSIDETTLSNGELYTIVTNKAAKGRKGAIVAIVEGTKSDEVIQVLNKTSETLLDLIEELILGMAESTAQDCSQLFSKSCKI